MKTTRPAATETPRTTPLPRTTSPRSDESLVLPLIPAVYFAVWQGVSYELARVFCETSCIRKTS